MVLRFTLSVLAASLAALIALAPLAQAQTRGEVGQAVEPGLMQGATLRPGPVPAALPNLDDTNRDFERQRRAREAQRASANAGAAPVTGRVRGQVQRQVRAPSGLRQPPNRAVLPPTAARGSSRTTTGGIQELPADTPAIAPGLSEPLPARRRRPQPEMDPYAPLGISVGSFKVLPAIEGLVGYDTNALRGASGTKYKGSRYYQVVPELSVRSDWSRHALQFDMRGTYSSYQDVDNANRPTLDAKLNFRGDIRQDSTLTLELKERIDSQRPGSADLSSAVKGRPLYFVSTGSAAWAEKFGYATATSTATIDRYDYQDATTFAGTTLSQKDRNYTAYGLKLRGAYELTPGIAPFVEVAGDVRVHDEKFDAATYRRNSHGATAKIGSTFELSRILTGEVSGGWGIRRYDDYRLSNLTGAVADASLVWQLTPLTKVTAKAGTEFVETVQSGSPGALSRKVSLEIAHDLLRNLTLTGTAGFTHASYKGINRIEDTISAGLKADYRIDRAWIVRGSYAYERSLSNSAATSNLAHVFLMGVRLQQ